MVKTIILVRHGESEKDKNNPERKLTINGKRQIKSSAKKLASLVMGKNSLIITTQTARTKESASILAKILGINIKETQVKLRVDNFDLIEKKYPKDKNQIFKYFDDFENNDLNNLVPPPTEVASRFLKVVGKLEEEIIVIVGHGAALESFVLYQDIFMPIKKLTRELKYAEFIVLERSKC